MNTSACPTLCFRIVSLSPIPLQLQPPKDGPLIIFKKEVQVSRTSLCFQLWSEPSEKREITALLAQIFDGNTNDTKNVLTNICAWATKDPSEQKNKIFHPKEHPEILREGNPHAGGENVRSGDTLTLLCLSLPAPPCLALSAWLFLPLLGLSVCNLFSALTHRPKEPRAGAVPLAHSPTLSSLHHPFPPLSLSLIGSHPHLYSHTLTLQRLPHWEEGGAPFPGHAQFLPEPGWVPGEPLAVVRLRQPAPPHLSWCPLCFIHQTSSFSSQSWVNARCYLVIKAVNTIPKDSLNGWSRGSCLGPRSSAKCLFQKQKVGSFHFSTNFYELYQLLAWAKRFLKIGMIGS